MSAVELVLANLWRARSMPDRPYLLLNDPRGYFADAPKDITIDGSSIPVHHCANEWALRLYTESEREAGNATPRILISLMQLEPDHLPDLQARSSKPAATMSGTAIASALGVEQPRPIIDRVPVPLFWGLGPFLHYLNQYKFERVLLASLLGDAEVLSAGWPPERVLDKLWYEGSLTNLHIVLDAVEPNEKRVLETEFFTLIRPWIDGVRLAVVEVAVLEQNPPPVLPLCLLASILDRWNSLTPQAMHKFIDGSVLGDLFVDVLKDDADLSGLADWGRRIAFRADDQCLAALAYLETEVFPRHPAVLTEALSGVIKSVGGSGAERLLGQLVRLLEADGGLLAQGLTITLQELLGLTSAIAPTGLPLESVSLGLTDRLEAENSLEWQRLLDALRRHQSRERYEDQVSLLEALITLHKLTGQAEDATKTLTGLDWKKWIPLVDRIYLPLSAQVAEAERLLEGVPQRINLYRILRRAKQALETIATAYVPFYLDPHTGLQKWVADRSFAAGASRPWLNSDVVEYAVKPLLIDAGIEHVYLIVFDGMSVPNWTMLRDRFLMAKGRELFRPYNGTGPEYRAFTYLPSITHLCRRAIFAGAPPSMFATWFKGTSEAHLIDRCLSNLNCKPSDWDLTKHYFCFNEKDANPELLRRDLRTLIDSPVRLKAIVFNLQDRLLDKSGVSSLQEIMLTYVREVALLYLRRIAAQPKTAVVITADHGFTRYDKKYVIDDLNVKGGGKQVNIHNRCLEYLSTAYTTKGPATSARITSPAAFGLPPTWTAADLALGQDSYGWPSPSSSSAHNPYQVNGHDHGGLTPEETVVPVAVYVTRS